MITADQVSTIKIYCTDMIGEASILYHAGAKLHPLVEADHEADLHRSFLRLAEALGYRAALISSPTPAKLAEATA